MRISQRSIERVREAADIVEVASEFTALRRQGARYTGLCPYHQEKTPSFSVSPGQGFYYCFGCNKGGDAIKLLTELKNLSFSDAVTELSERYGVELEFEGSPDHRTDEQRRRAAEERRSGYKALAAAVTYYHKYLLQSSAAERARNYLEERGIKISTIKEFKLGYSPPRGNRGFLDVAEKVGLKRDALESAGLVSGRGGERFAGRITFPISDRRGRMVGFGARALGDEKPKYLNSPETVYFNKRTLLYGIPQVAEGMRKTRTAIVVEGYTDVLMLYQAGIRNAVATLGTAITGHHLKSLSGYADRIYLLFDPDEAGERAVERAATETANMQLDLHVLNLRGDHGVALDPADWLLEHEPDEFSERLKDATPILEYSIRRIAERTFGAGAADRSRAVPEVRELMGRIEDPVMNREALRLASEALRVDPAVLRQEVQRGASARPQQAALAQKKLPEDPLYRAGRELLSLMIVRPDIAADPLAEGLKNPALDGSVRLEPRDFAHHMHRRLFQLLRDYAGQDIALALSDERARTGRTMDAISVLHAEGEKMFPSSASFAEAWLRVAVLSRERDKQETADFDEKEHLRKEIEQLKTALRSVPSTTPNEP